MNDLDSEDRALLDLARDGHEPSAADRQRVRRLLGASLGAAAGLATTAAGTSVAAGTGAASIATKLVVVAVVAAAAGAGGTAAYLMRGGHTRAPAAMAAMQAKAAPLPHTAAPPPRVALHEEPALEQPPARAPRPRPQKIAPLPQSPAEVVAPPAFEAAPSPPVVTPLPTTIEAETRLVRDGVAALHAGDPGRALVLFDEHARRYANGVLAEERSAERVFALHDLGRVADANQSAAAFLRDHPRSPLRARVRAACAPAPIR